MRIAIGNDHVGLDLALEIAAYARELGHEIAHVGTDSHERCDYPLFGKRVAAMVMGKEADRGILICGTGVGISLSANKVRGIRAVVCSEPYTATLSRAHNDTNVLALGARVVGPDLAKMIVDLWLNTQFEGGRHKLRIDMLEEPS